MPNPTPADFLRLRQAARNFDRDPNYPPYFRTLISEAQQFGDWEPDACPAGGDHVLARAEIDGMTFPDECENCGEPRPHG